MDMFHAPLPKNLFSCFNIRATDSRMEEINTKYIVNKFKARSGKQSDIQFEEINVDFYRPAAQCTPFWTTEERILHWIHAIQICYFVTLADSTDYLVQCFDRPNYDSVGFKRLPGKTKGTRKKSNHQSVIPEKPCAQATSHYETPKPNWKKRNSLDSMRSLSAKQSNTVSELKSVISELESDVTEIKNALDISNCENKLSSLQDKIIQISNLSKASIQTLSCKNSEIRN